MVGGNFKDGNVVSRSWHDGALGTLIGEDLLVGGARLPVFYLTRHVTLVMSSVP